MITNYTADYSVLSEQWLGVRGKRISHPLVKAFVFSTGEYGYLFVNVGINAYVKASRIGFFGVYSLLFAHGQENIQRGFPFFSQVVGIVSVEISSAVQTDELTAKHLNLAVVADKCFISGFASVKSHDIVHCLTPLSSSHFRTLATAPLSVVGLGCGRWNTRHSPNNLTPMREPSRSDISAPSSINKLSISDHLILPLIGRENMSASVFWCLRFMGIIVPLFSTAVNPILLQLVRPCTPTHANKRKKHLTNKGHDFSIESLTKTSSGHPHPKALRFFYACQKALLRLYDGSRRLNKIPFTGNKSRRLDAVSEARRLYFNKVAKSKLKHLGGLIMPNQKIAILAKHHYFLRLKYFLKGYRVCVRPSRTGEPLTHYILPSFCEVKHG